MASSSSSFMVQDFSQKPTKKLHWRASNSTKMRSTQKGSDLFGPKVCVCVCFRMIDLLDQPPGSKRLNFFLETIVSQGKRIESPGVFTNECIYNDMSKANWLYRFKSACYLKKQERFKILSQVIVSSYIFHMYSKTIDRSGPMISHPDNIKDEVVPKKCLKPSPQQPLQVAFNEASRCSSKLPHSPRAVAVPRRMMVASASLSWKRARGIVRDAGI